MQGWKRSRSLVNLLLSMVSNTAHDSLVKLSLSPYYGHQYASIYDPMHYLAEDEHSYRRLQKQVLDFCWSKLDSDIRDSKETPLFLTTDSTPYRCEYTTTLADRQAISVPNATRLSRTQLSVG